MTKSEMMLPFALEHNIPVCHIGGTGLWMWHEWAQPILQPKLGPWPTPASFVLYDALLNRRLPQIISTDLDYEQWRRL